MFPNKRQTIEKELMPSEFIFTKPWNCIAGPLPVSNSRRKPSVPSSSYLVGPYYTGPKLTPDPSTPSLIGVVFQICTVKLS